MSTVITMRPKPAVLHDAVTITVDRALLRLKQEVDELAEAIESRRRAAILNELVDVAYFTQQLAALHDINSGRMADYAALKGVMRREHIKDKAIELRVATAVLDGCGYVLPLIKQEEHGNSQ